MATRKSSVFYGLLIAFTSLVVGMIIASRLDLTPHSSAANGPLTVPETNSAPLQGPIDATTFRNIAKLAGPAVVSIRTTSMQTAPRGDGGDLEEFFGFPNPFANPNRRQPRPQARPVQGAGSGFIIDKAGYILTNNHVVADATEISIYLSTMHELEDGLPATVVGRDELTDTALLQLTNPPDDLQVMKFGDSSQMAPGDWVMAIGNPFNLSNTVTVGIVSAAGRPAPVSNGRWEDYIQTDAAINRGNSGGPLLNIRGEVVGINTMIVTSDPLNMGTGGNVGVGFAVPINTVRDLLPQLHEGKVTRGRIGVSVIRKPMTEEYAKQLGLPRPTGAEIQSVESGAPADKAGLRAGDVITEFKGQPVRDNSELVSLVASTRPGTTVPLKVVRNRDTITLNVTVAELDLDAERAAADAPDDAAPTDAGFGMSISPLTAREREDLEVPEGRGGAVVTDVAPFGPAAQGLVAPGDVILSIQGETVSSPQAVADAIDAIPAGRTARVIVWRFDQRRGSGQEVLVQVRKR